MKGTSPFAVFRESPPEDDTAWLASALSKLPAPASLKERNLLQLMLIDRYSTQFRTTKLAALRRIADTYADRFPH